MAIYKVDDGFVISSGGMWLPGCYDSERTARLAFKLPNETLRKFSGRKTPVRYDDVLAEYRAMQATASPD